VRGGVAVEGVVADAEFVEAEAAMDTPEGGRVALDDGEVDAAQHLGS